ncbi:hypothetical protein B0J14DRAFT_356383 [Halenospora varia]|nr:hypothetical protein B0J14DRAFT_356383 [Halenospora varia]
MAGDRERQQYDGGPSSSSSNNASAQPAEPSTKKTPKWSTEEDALIRELREGGMKWEEISKRCPGRSPISCRLHYQIHLRGRGMWDEERMNKLARLYERFTKEMWKEVAEEMRLANEMTAIEEEQPAIGVIVSEEEPRAIEMMVIDEEQNRPQRSHRSPRFLFHVSAIEVFLAPTIIVSGMMAQQSDSWKPVFVSLYGMWLILLTTGLYLDLRLRENLKFAK